MDIWFSVIRLLGEEDGTYDGLIGYGFQILWKTQTKKRCGKILPGRGGKNLKNVWNACCSWYTMRMFLVAVTWSGEQILGVGWWVYYMLTVLVGGGGENRGRVYRFFERPYKSDVHETFDYKWGKGRYRL